MKWWMKMTIHSRWFERDWGRLVREARGRGRLIGGPWGWQNNQGPPPMKRQHAWPQRAQEELNNDGEDEDWMNDNYLKYGAEEKEVSTEGKLRALRLKPCALVACRSSLSSYSTAMTSDWTVLHLRLDSFCALHVIHALPFIQHIFVPNSYAEIWAQDEIQTTS